jgi:hypothetical protein
MILEDRFKPRCHEVEHRRKIRMMLVNCLSEASFLERRTFREAQKSPKDRVAGPLPAGPTFDWGQGKLSEKDTFLIGKPPNLLVGGFTGRIFFWFVFFGRAKKMNKEYSRSSGRTSPESPLEMRVRIKLKV